jgi:methionyl aminopeptidase
VAVTDTGFEILTPWRDGLGDYAAIVPVVSAASPLGAAMAAVA